MKLKNFSLVEFHDIDRYIGFHYNILRSSTKFCVKTMRICFIGHQSVVDAEQLKIRIANTVSKLISDGADTFLFGSRSQFDTLCWEVVTELQTQYPNIKRLSYNTPHETAITSNEELRRFERIYAKTAGVDVRIKDYASDVKSQKSVNATKDTYIMRNQNMIDDSDVCVFYYDKSYLPPKRKQSKNCIWNYQPRSGTAVAFDYAKRKNKRIINLFD